MRRIFRWHCLRRLVSVINCYLTGRWQYQSLIPWRVQAPQFSVNELTGLSDRSGSNEDEWSPNHHILCAEFVGTGRGWTRLINLLTVVETSITRGVKIWIFLEELEIVENMKCWLPFGTFDWGVPPRCFPAYSDWTSSALVWDQCLHVPSPWWIA
jgi:hypothetical protein